MHKVTSPAISVTLAIEPAVFLVKPDNQDLPTVSLTVTSHASQAITIHTASSILDLALAQVCGNFTCTDIATDQSKRIRTRTGPCCRYGYDRTRVRGNDKNFLTLEPELPVTLSYSFALASPRLALSEGRRYRFAVNEGEVLRNWWYGRKQDVMASPSILEWPLRIISRHRPLLEVSGEPIDVPATSVEFEILPQKAVSE